jgi:hypothetical protein
MIRLLRDQKIELAREHEIEIGIQHVTLHMKDGREIDSYVHDFEWIDSFEVNPTEIKKIEVLDY